MAGDIARILQVFAEFRQAKRHNPVYDAGMSGNGPSSSDARHPPLVMGLDVGGTGFRTALVDAGGEILAGSLREESVDGAGGASGILKSLAECIRFSSERGVSAGAAVAGIGASVPGPFDYEAGISRMAHKLPAIQGLPLRERMREMYRVDGEFPILFFHDIHAFLFGEYLYGAARGFRDVFAVSIGSGLGTALLRRGRIVANRAGGPAYSLFRTPYRGRIIEDIVSRRGILRRYAELAGRDADADVDAVAARARLGDKAALAVFREMGEVLAAVLGPCVDSMRLERIVFGGRISGAFDLFAPALREGLSRLLDGGDLVAGEDLAMSSIKGAAALLFAPEAIYNEGGGRHEPRHGD
jgi:glucokinase